MDDREALNVMSELCMDVLKKATPEVLDQATREAEGQTQFHHPLKMGTTKKINEHGNHNLKVLAKLRELRDVIVAGAPEGRQG